nr:hypothetical protein [Tanacetum cinerariifolium]
MHTTQDLEEPTHQEFVTGEIDDQPIEEASHHPNWFQKKAKPPTPDRDWNKTFPATHGRIQPLISNLANKDDSLTLFNKLMDTLVDFSAFVMNRLKVDTLTPELLANPTYELMKGSCKSLVKLEFYLEEGRHVIPFDHFINNDLEYLRGSASSRKYTTSVTKTPRQQIMDTLNGLKTWYLIQCGVKYRLAMINMLSGESCIGGANINSSMDLQSIGNLLEMSTPYVESSLSQSFKSSNGITTSIWIRSLYVEMMKSSTNSRKAISKGFAFKTLKTCCFSWFKRQGKDFSGKVTPLFKTMMVQPQEDMGEDSEIPPDSHHIPTVTQPSTSSQPQQKQKFKKSKKRITKIPQISDFTYDVADEHVTTTSIGPLLSETTKANQALNIRSLKRKVKRLEKKASKKTHKLKRLYKIGSSIRVESLEDAGRNDQDMFDTSILDDEEIVAEKEVSTAEVVTTAAEVVTTAGVEVSTAAITSQISMDEITLSKALIDIKTSKPKAKGIVIQEPTQMQAELEEEERLASQKEEEANIALIKSWDNIQAMMDADYELAARLQEEEIGELSIEEKSKLFVQLLDARNKHFASLRAKEKRSKPPTKAQKRNQMCTYLKNMANYKHNQLKNNKLVKCSEKAEEGSEKATEGSSKRAATIKTRFGGNEATKKTQKTLLKQLYENFSATSTKSLEFIFNRLQKINTHVVVWRNKSDLDIMSIDDLYNNFKIVEQKVKRTSSSNSSSQNIAFMSSPSTNSTNEVYTAYEVSTASIQSSTASTQVGTANSQNNTANLSDATIYAFLANQLNGKKITINGSDIGGVDKSKVKCYNCHNMGHFEKECRGPRKQDSRNMNQDSSRRAVHVEKTPPKMVAIDGVGFDWSFMADNEVPTNMALMDFSDSESLDKLIGSQIPNNSKKGLGYKNYHAVLPPPTGLFLPPKLDLSNSGLEEFKQPEFESYGPKVLDNKDCSVESPVVVEKKTIVPTIATVEVVRPKQQKNQELVVIENNYSRLHSNNSTRKTHPSAYRNMAPRAVLMKTGLRPINTVRPINTAHPKTTVYIARPMSHFSKLAQSIVKRLYQQRTSLPNKSFSQKVNTTKGKVNTVRPRAVNTARPNLVVVNAVRENQFWATKKFKTVNGEEHIQALVDKKKVIITEASVTSDIYLEDAKGIECLPTATVFKQLTLMGYEKLTQKLPFYKAFFSPQWKFFIQTILQCLSAKTTAWNEFSSTMAAAIICLAQIKNFNFSKYIFDHMVKNLEDGVKFLMFPRFVQVFLDSQVEGMVKHQEIYVTPSHTKKFFANMKRHGKDFSRKITPLFETMMVQPQEDLGEDSEIPTDSCHTPTVTQPSTSSQPQQMQKFKKSKKGITEVPQPSYFTHDVADEHVITTSNDPLLSSEDRLKLTELMELCTQLQSRFLALEITKANQTLEIGSLKRRVKKLEKKAKKTHKLKRLYKIGSSTRVESFEDAGLGNKEDASKQGRMIDDSDADEGVTLVDETQGRNDQDMFDTITTAGVEVSTATITSQISMDEITLAKALTDIKTSKPKAKGIVIQEPSKTPTPTPIDSSQQPSKDKDKDYELAARLQEEERRELTIKEKSRLFVELMDKRKKYFAGLRAEKIRSKPPTYNKL